MDNVTAPLPSGLTVQQFIAWAMGRPETEHYELHDGEVVAMAAERAGHSRIKTLIGHRLLEAIESAGLECAVFVDNTAVAVGTGTTFEPDVVLCGPPLPHKDVLYLENPMIVVEVLSPSTEVVDKTRKLAGYFEIPALRHYLIVDADHRQVEHHRRGDSGAVSRTTVGFGPIALDPPGIVLDRFWPD